MGKSPPAAVSELFIIKNMSYETYLKEKGIKEKKIRQEWIQRREELKNHIEELMAKATVEELKQMVRNLWGRIDAFKSVLSDPDRIDNK